MPSKIKQKLQEMRLQAEHEVLLSDIKPRERAENLGRATACTLLLSGMTPETLLETANHPIFAGVGDRPALIQVAQFFKGLL